MKKSILNIILKKKGEDFGKMKREIRNHKEPTTDPDMKNVVDERKPSKAVVNSRVDTAKAQISKYEDQVQKVPNRHDKGINN